MTGRLDPARLRMNFAERRRMPTLPRLIVSAAWGSLQGRRNQRPRPPSLTQLKPFAHRFPREILFSPNSANQPAIRVWKWPDTNTTGVSPAASPESGIAYWIRRCLAAHPQSRRSPLDRDRRRTNQGLAIAASLTLSLTEFLRPLGGAGSSILDLGGRPSIKEPSTEYRHV